MDEKSADLPKAFHLVFFSCWRKRCDQWSPLISDSPGALQLREQILKEQITDDRLFFKMSSSSVPSGCGLFPVLRIDGHDRCLQCLGFQHAEDASWMTHAPVVGV